MSEILILLLMLFVARFGGEIAMRFGQSPMLGEILGGLILGPTILGLIVPTESIQFLSHLGILFLMFLAGLETDLNLIRKVAGPSVVISIAGAALSFGLGYAVGALFGLSGTASIFLGAALSTSSIVVTARVLGDYGMMRSEVGLLSMAVNAVDDVLSMFIVLLLVSLVGAGAGGEASDPIWLMLAKLAAYAVIATGIGLFLFRPIMSVVDRTLSSEMHFSVAILLVLLFSWAAEALGLADVLGAFIVGAFLRYTEEAEPTVISRVEATADGFLVPIFFAAMGVQTNLRELLNFLPLLGVVLLAAVAGKLIGCGGGARLMRYSWRDSYIIGAGMVPRAEMTLVLLGIGLSAGVLPPVMPPLLVSLVFLSALVTGPLLRAAFLTDKSPSG